MKATGMIKAQSNGKVNYGLVRCFCLTLLLLVLLITGSVTPVWAANEGDNIRISVKDPVTNLDENGLPFLQKDDQQNPNVIALPDKNKWFVVWEDWRDWDKSGADIYGRFINGDGTYCGGEIAISTVPGNQTVPTLAYRNDPTDANDNILIAWQDTRNTSGYLAYKILNISSLSANCSLGATSLGVERVLGYTPIGSDSLISRKMPKAAYDAARDKFWLTWIESRNALQRIEEHPFGVPSFVDSSSGTRIAETATWSFGDLNYIGYVAVGVNGAAGTTQVIRNMGSIPVDSDSDGDFDSLRESVRSVRLISHSISNTEDVYIYEYFKNVNNVSIACDDSSPETLIVWEGTRGRATLTCTYEDQDNSETPSLGDAFSSELVLDEFENDDGKVHIFSIFDKYIGKSVVKSQLVDASTVGSNYPAAAFDSAHRKFLVAWEDRDARSGAGDGIHSKIFGQLIYSGGGLYGNNIPISFQDTDGDGKQDPNILNSNQTRPQISIDPTNQRFFVTWQDGRNSQVSLENLDIFGQFVDSEGSLRGNNYAVCVEPANQYNPVTAFNSGNHQFFSVWKDARNFKATEENDWKITNSDIYGQRFTMGQPQLILLKDDNTPLVPPLLDFGTLNPDEEATLSVTMKNTGDSTIKIDYVTPLEAPYSYISLPPELVVEGDSGDNSTIDLVPGASYKLYVNFKPTANGTFIDNFGIRSDATNLVVNLQGIAVPPPPVVTPEVKIVPSPSSHSFGSVNLGESATQLFTFTNNGTVDVAIGQTVVPDGFTVMGLSGTIKVGTSFVTMVTFTPVQPRPYSGNLLVFFSEGVAPVSIGLSGVGRGNIQASVIPPGNTNFGNVAVGETKSVNLVFTNTGNVDLVITAIDLPEGAGFSVSGLPATIPVYGSLTALATFSPTMPQVYSSTLRVLYEHGVPASEIRLSGVGVYDINDVIDVPGEVNFGDCNTGDSKNANLRFINKGSVDVAVTAVDLPEGVFAVSGIPGKIPAYGVLDALVTFTPLLEQDYDITMRVLYDQGVVTSDIKLKGSGVDISAPAISVAPQSFSFGRTALGTTKTKTLVVTNTGNVDLEIVGVDLPGALFKVEGISKGTLAAGMSTVGIVTFTPVAAGDFSGMLRLLFDHDLAPQEIMMQGVGVDIDVSPTTLEFPNSDIDSNTVLSVTITNSSNADIQVKGAVTGTDSYSVSGIAAGDIIRASGGSLTCQVTFKPTAPGYLEDGLYFNVGPVQDLENIPFEEIDWGTQYMVTLKGLANADFVVSDFDTYTADIDYKVSVSASTAAAGQLFVLFSHDPLSSGKIYALTSNGTLKLFPYEASFGWQNLWYKAGAAPGMKLDLSQVDFRELGCTQCQGEKVDTGDKDFHFGNIITPPDDSVFNNASDFKYMPGTLYMGTYVKNAASSGVFDFNKGLLEMQSLHINSLAGTWQVTSEYNGVDQVHPTHLVVTEAGDGNISAFWPGYNAAMVYASDTSGYVMTFSMPRNGVIYNYTYNITSLTADKFSGTYTCIANGEVLEDAPMSGVRLQSVAKTF